MRTPKAALPATGDPPASSRRPRSRVIAKKSELAPAPPDRPIIRAVGRRKTSVARVRLMPGGTGEFSVNQKPISEYFQPSHLQDIATSPLKVAGKAAEFVCSVKVAGGGTHSQAEAIRHGVSRALLRFDPLLRATLKPLGFLRRDPRMKERKKPGLRRARRAPQWAKR